MAKPKVDAACILAKPKIDSKLSRAKNAPCANKISNYDFTKSENEYFPRRNSNRNFLDSFGHKFESKDEKRIPQTRRMKWTNKRLLRLQKWAGNVPKKETGAIYGWNVLKDTEFENFTRTICRESERKLYQNIRFVHSLKNRRQPNVTAI